VRDPTSLPALRATLPQPDRLTHPSDWEDVQVINPLDGFNLQPRLSLPFDGAIDPYSVSSENVFLMSLGSTTGEGGDAVGRVVGINQVVWDVATNALHVESDELLSQHTRYLLVATRGLRGVDGQPVAASPAFRAFVDGAPAPGEPVEVTVQRAWLRVGLTVADALGVVPEGEVVAASVFTTQSATAVLEKLRDQIHA